jgi:phosphoglycerate dehydrogenase-like enzyme
VTGPVVVLAPDEPGAAVLAQINGVSVVAYRGPEVPPGGSDAEVLVAGDHEGPALTLVANLPRLRMVQTMNAGVERWLPHLPPHILLSNARGAHGGVTAELAMTALLALVRDLPSFLSAQQEHRWAPHEAGTLLGASVLVLGAGDVAVELRNRLEPFGARVTLLGRTARDGVEGMAALHQLLPAHDAVVVTLPLNEETRGLVDSDFLSGMREHAILVNVGRGGIVDAEALAAQLRAGRLRAALDVTEPEPLPADHPIWEAPGLLITPHVGGSAPGRAERAWQVAARQIAAFVAGRQPDNIVSR